MHFLVRFVHLFFIWDFNFIQYVYQSQYNIKKNESSSIQTWNFWKLFLPGLPAGVLLHYLKKYHKKFKLPPVAVMPAFLILPLVIFYVVMFMTGADMDHMRDEVRV